MERVRVKNIVLVLVFLLVSLFLHSADFKPCESYFLKVEVETEENKVSLKPEFGLRISCESLGGSQPTRLSESFQFICGQPIHVGVTLFNQAVIEDMRMKRAQYKEKYIQSVMNETELPEQFRYKVPEELVDDLPAHWLKNITFSLKSSNSDIPQGSDNSFINGSEIRSSLNQTPYKSYLPKRVERSAFFVFDLSPEQTRNLNPGKYTFVVSYENEELNIKKEVEIEFLSAESESQLTSVIYEEAYYYWQHGNVSLAVERAEQVASKNPAYKNYDVYLLLCQAYKKQGNIPSSLDACNQFLKFNKEDKKMRGFVEKFRNQLNQ